MYARMIFSLSFLFESPASHRISRDSSPILRSFSFSSPSPPSSASVLIPIPRLVTYLDLSAPASCAPLFWVLGYQACRYARCALEVYYSCPGSHQLETKLRLQSKLGWKGSGQIETKQALGGADRGKRDSRASAGFATWLWDSQGPLLSLLPACSTPAACTYPAGRRWSPLSLCSP